MSDQQDVIIVGAGQAGLAMGALLQSAGVNYLIIGQESCIGDIWRNRYESLTLFTPRWLNRLPLDSSPMTAASDEYPDRNEIADYLLRYAEARQLNIRLATTVIKLAKSGSGFTVQTDTGEKLSARAVVIATGPFQKASIPQFAKDLAPRVVQIHTAHYRNARQLQPGRTLVVGAGNSGAQIAASLTQQHEVHLAAGGPLNFMPSRLLGKSIFWWFNRLGVYRAHVGTALGRRLSRRPDPIIGRELRECLQQGHVTLHPRAAGADGNHVVFKDGTSLPVDNVIWATGFRSDYSWVELDGVVSTEGQPVHRRGVAEHTGVYFLGLPWQHSRKSALIGGVGDDAAHLLQVIRAQLAEGSCEPSARPLKTIPDGGCQTS